MLPALDRQTDFLLEGSELKRIEETREARRSACIKPLYFFVARPLSTSSPPPPARFLDPAPTALDKIQLFVSRHDPVAKDFPFTNSLNATSFPSKETAGATSIGEVSSPLLIPIKESVSIVYRDVLDDV